MFVTTSRAVDWSAWEHTHLTHIIQGNMGTLVHRKNHEHNMIPHCEISRCWSLIFVRSLLYIRRRGERFKGDQSIFTRSHSSPLELDRLVVIVIPADPSLKDQNHRRQIARRVHCKREIKPEHHLNRFALPLSLSSTLYLLVETIMFNTFMGWKLCGLRCKWIWNAI